jgi:replicative DNA helicase
MDMRTAPEWAPISIENEQAVLGTLLQNNSGMALIRDFIRVDHFYDPCHRLIFECIESLTAMGKVASPLSIKPFISDHQVTDGMTVSQYVARLAGAALPVSMLKDHAQIVRDLGLRRALMDVAYDITEPVPRDIRELAGKAVEDIDAVLSEQASHGSKGVSMGETMAESVDNMANAFKNNGRIMGLCTGLSALDRKLHGFDRGNLIVLGGRPGMGKSALATCWSRQLAERGYKGISFSLEMTAREQGDRMIADALFNNGPVTYRSLSSGHFDEPTFLRVTDIAKAIASLPLRIEPQGGQSFAQIAARARMAKNREGLDFAVIDHLQIVKSLSRHQNRVRELGEITSGLKALAKELDIVVILLSQLSRALESREDKRPTLNDLRESGDIEQDADVVIMAFRESYYLERREPPPGTPEHAVWQTSVVRARNKLELLVEKQRGGPTGTVEVFCNIGCNAVRDLDEHETTPTAAIPRPSDDDARFL